MSITYDSLQRWAHGNHVTFMHYPGFVDNESNIDKFHMLLIGPNMRTVLLSSSLPWDPRISVGNETVSVMALQIKNGAATRGSFAPNSLINEHGLSHVGLCAQELDILLRAFMADAHVQDV